jgi:hypothetical protein
MIIYILSIYFLTQKHNLISLGVSFKELQPVVDLGVSLIEAFKSMGYCSDSDSSTGGSPEFQMLYPSFLLALQGLGVSAKGSCYKALKEYMEESLTPSKKTLVNVAR